jgi:ATP-dependent RNA helicase DeaD
MLHGEKMNEFEKTGLRAEILEAIGLLGFEKPTPVQAKVIPFVLESTQDLVALAQTGTGKTAAFGLPILSLIEKMPQAQALILAPTRELCIQITKDMKNFALNRKSINIVPVYGGAPVDTQIREIKRGADIVVGTPGRLNDLLRRKILNITAIRWLVLDEADEMLSMGFREELESILSTTPETKQVLLFSATMPESLKDNFMKDPQEFVLGERNTGNINIEHLVYKVKSPNRYLALKRIVDNNPDMYGIIFCRTRNETKEVAEKLIKDGYNSDALHGELTQSQRDNVMKLFRQRHLKMLIATDVAARGLDVNDLTHVINFNLPDDAEVYTHRSGRTGRAGKMGVSIAIINTREQRKIDEIERRMKVSFKKSLVPGGKEICQTRLFELIKRVEDVELKEGELKSFIDPILDQLSKFERDELIKRFVSVEFNRFLDYYKDAVDINIKDGKDTKHGNSVSKNRNSHNERTLRRKNHQSKKDEYIRLSMNAGRNDGLGVVEVITLVKKTTGNRNIKLGVIDLNNQSCFFEVMEKDRNKVIESFKNHKFKNRKLKVSTADTKQERKKYKK